MIITKQRMTGYTPLRQRHTGGQIAVPPSAPVPVEPAPPAPAPREPVSPVDVIPVPVDQPTLMSDIHQAHPVTSKERMASYVPLRQRGHNPVPAAPGQPEHPIMPSGATAMTSSMPAPAVIETPTVGPTTTAVTIPVPQNRMRGYTPLRQHPSDTAVQEPVAIPTDQARVDKPKPVMEQPTVVVTAPVTSKSTSAESPRQEAANQPHASRWVRPALFVGGAVVLALMVVLAARTLRSLESVQAFIATYDGHSTMPSSAPTGMPWWMGWQHFLNLFFMALIIRTGLQIRHERRPEAMWTPRADSFYSPKNNTPKKVSITIWLHQTLDVLWVVNGLVFVILLAVTGHWMRVVPTSWDVFPNSVSVALQYASFDWPTENGWIHYNALQMISYFLIIYVAAPLAVLTGLRMSSWWPAQATGLNRIFPVELARKLHFPVMVFFVLFILAHVFLVFTTGALRNLNHMYTSRDVADVWGLVVLVVSVAITALAWALLRPAMVIPLASKVGTVSKN